MDIKALDKIVGQMTIKYPQADFSIVVTGDKTLMLGVWFMGLHVAHKVTVEAVDNVKFDLLESEFERLVKELAKQWFVKAQIDIDEAIKKAGGGFKAEDFNG